MSYVLEFGFRVVQECQRLAGKKTHGIQQDEKEACEAFDHGGEYAEIAEAAGVCTACACRQSLLPYSVYADMGHAT